MPYIPQEDREDINDNGRFCTPADCGELNYRFAMIINDYIHKHHNSYQTFNDIIGALACQSQELYRRKIAPYEDMKCNKNGDVYDP